MDFKKILNRKIKHYGKTEAAYEFAAEEYGLELFKQSQTEYLKLKKKKNMKNRKVLKSENLKPKSPLGAIALGYLIIEKFNVPEWLWGAFIVLALL